MNNRTDKLADVKHIVSAGAPWLGRPVLVVILFFLFGPLQADPGLVSLSVRDTDIAEVMNMLAEKEKVNILLAKEVKGKVSLNLYDVELDKAVKAVARAAGFAVERRGRTYFVIKPDDKGSLTTRELTKVRTFKIQYTDTDLVKSILENYLSSYGKITALPERKMLVVEDMPEYVSRVESILAEVDVQPKQILIEAKVLEVTLDDSDTFGVDWARLFTTESGNGRVGVTGLTSKGSPGLFFEIMTPHIEAALNTLETKGRVRTLSTPKLLALENQEASVIIGDRLGFKVTTTINQVTTESVEFLESGIILRVTPSVDAQGRVMLNIHPEVSNGKINDGIPSQTTTEVTTKFLANDGQTIFIGGLLKNSTTESRDGVPVLGSLPAIGSLFSKRERVSLNTETVVLITPYIVHGTEHPVHAEQKARVDQADHALQKDSNRIRKYFNRNKKYPVF